MRLILGAINGDYLANILEEAARSVDNSVRTEEVWAAVAYARGFHDQRSLIRWCFDKSIPLKFWGRLDETVPVDIEILNQFLQKRSPDYVCKLVSLHHAKVIWWRGYGVYIGSANLTYSAWNKNVEAGCFFEESELDATTEGSLRQMFDILDSHSSVLTDELRDLMVGRAKKLKQNQLGDADFWAHSSIASWEGLIITSPKKANERQRRSFLSEWNETLQYLRDIAHLVSQKENRPAWIDPGASAGAQADQFLHAYYYHRTFDGRKADYARHFENNKHRKEAALKEAVAWWHSLSEAPSKPYGEDVAVNVTAPSLAKSLSTENLPRISEDDFRRIADNVHAMREYARRVPNRTVGLPDGPAYTMDKKLDALTSHLWRQRTSNGSSVVAVLNHVLYGGPLDFLPDRLWDAIADPAWKIESMGISAFGEVVGWAVPDRFPPRNGRTSKALRSLGYDVRVHVT